MTDQTVIPLLVLLVFFIFLMNLFADFFLLRCVVIGCAAFLFIKFILVLLEPILSVLRVSISSSRVFLFFASFMFDIFSCVLV